MVAAHSSQKLFGWFGGSGLSGTAGTLRKLGYEPAWLFAPIGGATELVGGLLLAVGLLTPLAGAMTLGMMVNAIVAVHWPVFWWTESGMEHPLTFAVVAATLAFTGPGGYAFDRWLPWRHGGSGWGVGSIALGLIVAAVVLIIRAL